MFNTSAEQQNNLSKKQVPLEYFLLNSQLSNLNFITTKLLIQVKVHLENGRKYMQDLNLVKMTIYMLISVYAWWQKCLTNRTLGHFSFRCWGT